MKVCGAVFDFFLFVLIANRNCRTSLEVDGNVAGP